MFFLCYFFVVFFGSIVWPGQPKQHRRQPSECSRAASWPKTDGLVPGPGSSVDWFLKGGGVDGWVAGWVIQGEGAAERKTAATTERRRR